MLDIHAAWAYDLRMTQGRTEPTIRRFQGTRRFADGTTFTGVTYWVGMSLPVDRDADDYTMEEITHRYVTRRALVNAIADGTAWLDTDTEDAR